jgi:hypothetical protein
MAKAARPEVLAIRAFSSTGAGDSTGAPAPTSTLATRLREPKAYSTV